MDKTQLRTEFDSPESSPGFLLWRITNKWQAEQRTALRSFGLTHVQFVLLASLVWMSHKTSPTQRQLAAFAHTDTMMTSQIVRKLERKRLLTRTVSPIDSRSFILSPTQMGVELSRRAIETVEAVDRNFFAALGNDTQEFTSMMQNLARQDNARSKG